MFLDSIARAVKPTGNLRKIYVPFGTIPGAGNALREEGWITVAGLEPENDTLINATKMNCTHVFVNGKATLVELTMNKDGH